MNGDDKGGDPPEVISAGPAEPYHVSGKPCAIALHDLLERIRQMKQDLADIELEANEIKRSVEGTQEDSE